MRKELTRVHAYGALWNISLYPHTGDAKIVCGILSRHSRVDQGGASFLYIPWNHRDTRLS